MENRRVRSGILSVESRTATLLTMLALSTVTQVGCGGEGGSDACAVGEACPCITVTDCPDPIAETCDLLTLTCQPVGAGDTGGDTNDAGDADVDDVEGTDADATTDVLPDAEDVSDAADAGDSDTQDASDVEDTSDVVDADVGDTSDVTDTTDTVDVGDTADVTLDTVDDVEEDITVPPVFELFDPYIAFQSNRPSGLNQIWVIPSSGGDAVHINTGDSVAESPTWSPDGTEIAYVAVGRRTRDLKIVDVTTGEVRTISLSTPILGIDSPDWSYDGSYIVVDGFFDSSGIGRDVFLVRVSDGQVTRLTTDDEDDYGARFDRFGNIYFVSTRAGDGDLFRMGRTPGTEEDLDVGATLLGRPAIGPEGDIVVASISLGGDNVDLVRITIETGTRLSVAGDIDVSPEIWPDGFRVSYTTSTFGGSDIGIANLTTGAATARVTTNDDTTFRNINMSVAPVEHLLVDLFFE